MKLGKSLLLGTAAGMIAVSGANAADMVVKAKPVLYVKICSLYGDGFYYIPGTDTCIKIGGYYRLQTEWNAGASGQAIGSGPVMAPLARFTRDLTNDINYTSRAVVSFDVRNQTEYGTLRSYIRAGWSVSTPGLTNAGTGGANAYWDRAFIQFAGFTVGRAQSFFDLFTYGGQYSYLNTRTAGDTGASGATVWAYTVNFGNGFTMTGSLEDPVFRRYGTCDGTAACWAINAGTTSDTAFGGQSTALNGFRVPDLVLNARIDQAWGYVGASVAVHDASGAYYQTGNNVNNGHPAEKYGWAAAVGGQLNLPGGDGVGINFVYSEGATGYAFNSGPWQVYNASTSVGVGWIQDGIFDITGTDIQLTRAWSVNAAYQHIWGERGTWGAKWKTSVYGGYVRIDYNDTATNIINAHLPGAAGTRPCGVPVAGSVWPPLNIAVGSGNSCSPDWGFWQVGSRTQFNPHPLLDIGLDVFYSRLDSAYKGTSVGLYPANGSRPTVSHDRRPGEPDLAHALAAQLLSMIVT